MQEPAVVILGVVADDITGAGDIGSMTAKAGYITHIRAFDGHEGVGPFGADVTILDTDSRLDPPETAYAKVHAATLALKAAGCRHFFNKTCSVFRGNVGAEFDAMLDALGEDFAVVVLGFPKNGRITRDGIHYVHGVRLEHSAFRHDPVHPMTSSNLVEILQSQTERRVALVSHEIVAQGAGALRGALRGVKAQSHYAIVDVVDQAALSTIAHAVTDVPVLCGSSALAEALPKLWPMPTEPVDAPSLPPDDGLGVLCIAGSLTPQTAAQLEHLKTQGVPSLVVDTAQLFEPAHRAREVERLVGEASLRLERGQDVLIHSENDPKSLAGSRARGAERGLSEKDVARLVSGALADVALSSRERTGYTRLVVAGGDTSAAVCRRLGITSMQVWQELAPGLPSCLSLADASGNAPMLLVLKSGSFGTGDFLERAMDHVKEAPRDHSPVL